MGALQPEGISHDTILKELKLFEAEDVNWQTGKVLSGLYSPGQEAHTLATEAYNLFLAQNALYVNMYPSIGRLESEIVASAKELLRADDYAAGNITSGGTESIMMAVKTARDWARENRSRIKDPEMVLPVTAHPAFIKAAHYFGLKAVQTPVDKNGFRADINAFNAALGPDTIIAAGSAPNFSHGTIDPIAEMSAAARAKNILFHVDGCVGGIYLSILRRMGGTVRDFDFSLPGVSSVSIDLHKYGYTPKNASVILYRKGDLRKYAWFVCTSTTQYAVINPTAQSTRTGGPIAAAWAVLRFLGEEGYRNIVRQSQEATRTMLDAIEKIDGIHVLGDPDMCMFTIASDQLNIFEIDDEMTLRGWHLLPQFACGGSPENLHFSLTMANIPHLQQLIDDLTQVVETLQEKGSAVNREKLKQTAEQLSDKSVEEIMAAIMESIGIKELKLPQRMAALNTILNYLPAERRDDLLIFFFNRTG
ncbi:MAG: pyridoxal phosphate-dependent decarboxylase family protein [Bacillota bacterium]